ncbi:MAG: sulfite exporter TauE/SafE family protein [Boseongicola sp.]|nr:sulfite exporter TauE/SafE family protein [Boseongicola sp.]
MLEPFAIAAQADGLWLLGLGAILAGIVRGFTGFGTAMVYLPVAAQVLGPFEALTSMIVMDLVAPLIHVPRALRDGHPPDVLRLACGALIALPLGVLVLAMVEPEVFRWGVSVVALGLLALLVAGVRYRGKPTSAMIYGTGLIGGFTGGSVGLPGPPVIILYMASTLPAAAVRANNTLYLILAELALLAVFHWHGFLSVPALALGGILILPYVLGNWSGAMLFQPNAERAYRNIAYLVIAGSAVMGLPLWD